MVKKDSKSSDKTKLKTEELEVKPLHKDKLLGKKLDMISKIKKDLAKIED